MEAIVERCSGLDVHQASVVACVLIGQAHQKPTKEIRTFGTTTRELIALRTWLKERGVTHIGMESTSVYWKPVYYVLEDESFELILGNARNMRNVPGRKTDVKDSEWIAGLVRHGLVAKSFVPPPAIRELRDLLRFRSRLVQSRATERNRLSAILEIANIKISSVLSDVFGVSGMRMLRALVERDSSVSEIADLAKGRLRQKIAELEPALEGRLQEHHCFILKLQIGRLDALDHDIATVETRIEEKLEPYRKTHTSLRRIPGVDRIVAAVLIAELGTDMTVFHGPGHVASWTGVCPGSHESAGKQRSGKTRKGNVHLRTVLVQAALSAARKKGTFLKDKYYRLRARRGPKRAALAIAHKILVSAYHMMSRGEDYAELGEHHLDQLSEKRVTKGLVKRLERLGYSVELSKVVA